MNYRQFDVIKMRLEDLHKAFHLPDIEERIMLMESIIHDIQDCLYWVKKEREIHE
jgi:hypothetical protein